MALARLRENSGTSADIKEACRLVEIPGNYKDVLRCLPKDIDYLLRWSREDKEFVANYLTLLKRLIQLDPTAYKVVRPLERVNDLLVGLSKIPLKDLTWHAGLYLWEYLALAYEIKRQGETLDITQFKFHLNIYNNEPFYSIQQSNISYFLSFRNFIDACKLGLISDDDIKRISTKRYKEKCKAEILNLKNPQQQEILSQIFTEPHSAVAKLFFHSRWPKIKKASEESGNLKILYPIYVKNHVEKIISLILAQNGYAGLFKYLSEVRIYEPLECSYYREHSAKLADYILSVPNSRERLLYLNSIFDGDNFTNILNYPDRCRLQTDLQSIRNLKLDDAELLNFDMDCFNKLVADVESNKLTASVAMKQILEENLYPQAHKYLLSRGDRSQLITNFEINFTSNLIKLLDKGAVAGDAFRILVNFADKQSLVNDARIPVTDPNNLFAIIHAKVNLMYTIDCKKPLLINVGEYFTDALLRLKPFIKYKTQLENNELETLLKSLLLQDTGMLSLDDSYLLKSFRKQLTDYIVASPVALQQHALDHALDLKKTLGNFFQMDLGDTQGKKECLARLRNARDSQSTAPLVIDTNIVASAPLLQIATSPKRETKTTEHKIETLDTHYLAIGLSPVENPQIEGHVTEPNNSHQTINSLMNSVADVSRQDLSPGQPIISDNINATTSETKNISENNLAANIEQEEKILNKPVTTIVKNSVTTSSIFNPRTNISEQKISHQTKSEDNKKVVCFSS